MKTSINKPLLLAALAAALMLQSLTAADSDARPPRRPGPPAGEGEADSPRGPRGQRMPEGRFQPGGGQAGGFQPGRGGMPMEAILNDEQREKFGEEMLAQREKNRELNEKFMKLRREVDQALFAEKVDEKLIREKSMALAEVEVERSLIRARAFAKIRPSLSEEQLERLKDLRSEMGRGPQGGPGNFRGPADGPRPGQRRPGPPEGAEGDNVLPPPAPQKRPAPPAK